MKRDEIVIAGGTGLIGTALSKKLERIGKYDIIILSRTPNKHKSTNRIRYLLWDGQKEIGDILENKYAIINLLGENIGFKPWTKKQKTRIMASRVQAAKMIIEGIQRCSQPPRVLIQASAVGIYPPQSRGDEYTTITNSNEFLSNVCIETEKMIAGLNNTNIRKIIIRTGLVFCKHSPLWKQLKLGLYFGCAIMPGKGFQYVPWIHLTDEVRAIQFLMESDSCSGVYNLAAPSTSTWRTIISNLQLFYKYSMRISVPEIFLKLFLGKTKANELVLKSLPVKPKKLEKAGFIFNYPNIETAVDSILNE